MRLQVHDAPYFDLLELFFPDFDCRRRLFFSSARLGSVTGIFEAYGLDPELQPLRVTVSEEKIYWDWQYDMIRHGGTMTKLVSSKHVHHALSQLFAQAWKLFLCRDSLRDMSPTLTTTWSGI